MTKEEWLARLGQMEWHTVEFKEARAAVPKSAYETVSAFANTQGGWLIFGVREAGRGFEIAGVADPDRVQNDFLSALRADNKVNHDIACSDRSTVRHGRQGGPAVSHPGVVALAQAPLSGWRYSAHLHPVGWGGPSLYLHRD